MHLMCPIMFCQNSRGTGGEENERVSWSLVKNSKALESKINHSERYLNRTKGVQYSVKKCNNNSTFLVFYRPFQELL